jgi:hypothetical protein
LLIAVLEEDGHEMFGELLGERRNLGFEVGDDFLERGNDSLVVNPLH